METVEIKLSKPVEIDGKQVDTLTMREPLVKDQMAAQENAGGSAVMGEVMLFASLCGIPHQVVPEMRAKDYRKMQDAYAGFTN